MAEIDLTETQANLEELDELEIPLLEEIPYKLFTKKNYPTTKLANDSDAAPLDGKNRWYKAS